MEKFDDRQYCDKSSGRKDTRKAYHKPKLTRYDDLRTLTLGSSDGGTESSNGAPVPFHNA